jgi:hypothetical protein
METHTNILQAVMRQIAKSRSADVFRGRAGCDIGGRGEKAQVLALLRDGAKGQVQDKIRLLAIAELSLLSAGPGR